MADKVKVLVVGLGNMGASHASAYHRNPGFEIVGLMSRSIKSKKIPAELAGYPLFEDYDEALKATKPDAVSINSWPNTHAEALRLGEDPLPAATTGSSPPRRRTRSWCSAISCACTRHG